MFSRTKSVGRFALSVEIITHRPTMGSFLSSGTPTSFPLKIAQTFHVTPPGEPFERFRSAGGSIDCHSIRLQYQGATGTTVVISQSHLCNQASATKREDLSTRPIPSASFFLHWLDNNGRRMGRRTSGSHQPGRATRQDPKRACTGRGLRQYELPPPHFPSDEPLRVKIRITSVPSGATPQGRFSG